MSKGVAVRVVRSVLASTSLVAASLVAATTGAPAAADGAAAPVLGPRPAATVSQ